MMFGNIIWVSDRDPFSTTAAPKKSKALSLISRRPLSTGKCCASNAPARCSLFCRENEMSNYDYIIVGAGAAGPVIAARLSEDPTVRVALLEAGKENTNDIGRMQGAFFYTWGSEMNWQYRSVPQAGLEGRQVDQPRGRVMGGSTAINVGAWLRGCAADYDAWEAAGAAGWNWKAALDTFKSVENTDRGPSEWRGRGGPLSMQDLPTPTEFSDTLLTAFSEAGLGPRGDANGETPYVADRYQTLFPEGKRHTPADAYLNEGVRSRPNLHVLTEALVTKVNFEGKRAVGVTYRNNGQDQTITAAREVILSAGAFNTPQLLMLSGVGPAHHLAAMGIACVADVPGVGSNLQDHLVISLLGLAPQGEDVSYNVFPGPGEIELWRKDHSGPAAYWPQNGVGFAQTRITSAGPDFELMFQYNPDVSSGVFGQVPDAQTRSGYTIAVILLQPKSRGTVRLASKEPDVHPNIDPAYLSDDDDIVALTEGLRLAQGIAATNSLKPYTEFLYPDLTATDEDIAAWIRKAAGIAFHPVGTARMGDLSDPAVVVDSQLRVRGVEGLRVADASVFPALIRGHTMAPTVFVGERAAQLIRNS